MAETTSNPVRPKRQYPFGTKACECCGGRFIRSGLRQRFCVTCGDKWRLADPQGFKARKDKHRSNPTIRLNDTVSAMVRFCLKGKKAGRTWKASLSYDLETLQSHLEKQFLRGMSWDNHGNGKGRWNIDHIRPVSSFSFDGAEHPDFADCWALSNLRPMWALENISKNDTRTHLL